VRVFFIVERLRLAQSKKLPAAQDILVG